MAGYYILIGGVVLFATVVGVWDLLSRRQNQSRQHKKSA